MMMLAVCNAIYFRAFFNLESKERQLRGYIYMDPTICAMNSVREDDRDAGNVSLTNEQYCPAPTLHPFPALSWLSNAMRRKSLFDKICFRCNPQIWLVPSVGCVITTWCPACWNR